MLVCSPGTSLSMAAYGSLIAYSSPIANNSPITNDHSWRNNSTFQFYPQGQPWSQMPTCRHPMPQLGPLCETPFQIPEVVVGGTDPLLELRPGIPLRSASVSSPWFLLQLGMFLPMPEALLDSWWIFSTIPTLHGFMLGALFSWYTSLYTLLISTLVISGQMSSMVEGSVPRSHLGEGCCWPKQIAWSCSFCPVALVWVNSQCIINGLCDPGGGHLGHSSRNTLASRNLSAS